MSDAVEVTQEEGGVAAATREAEAEVTEAEEAWLTEAEAEAEAWVTSHTESR